MPSQDKPSAAIQPGGIVRCRDRDWVLLPSEEDGLYRLRPLTGDVDQVVVIHRRLADQVAYSLREERLTSAVFPPPTAESVSDAQAVRLFWQSARLLLREGAAPLRSVGRISFRPRVYQFVPLLMALRLDPVRMLIADDVGVGKTIEALLIARELWDRGELRSLCVLCPPYLCDQWQQELTAKFNLEAAVITSGTVGRLERGKPVNDSIYQHYPIQVASIDFIKTERNRHQFLQFCPQMVIVDEAHGATVAEPERPAKQQRYQLVRRIAEMADRHLLLLTATPHSGVEGAFRSLLSHLDPDFASFDTDDLKPDERDRLARHFVLRTRADIEEQWEQESFFPRRESYDATYSLSPAYAELFQRTRDFCAELVGDEETGDRRQGRARGWGALALMRCIMSSPGAGHTALEIRRQTAGDDGRPLDQDALTDDPDSRSDDEVPSPAIETALRGAAADRRDIKRLQRLLNQLRDKDQDTKLRQCVQVVAELLNEGFHPIIWCRFVATAEYVAEQLAQRLAADFPGLRALAVTGRTSEEERRLQVDELTAQTRRVLVATDCLSEGINLQQHFNAVIHYDLPWNPNRLEQREGRVDRFGQTAEVVRAVRLYAPDNPVDGWVIRVLLDRARNIHSSLGVHVPVPDKSEQVMEALINALFRQRAAVAAEQLSLDFDDPQAKALHARWERDAERARRNRTRFAQRALKPEQVQRELEAVDAVLGDPEAVREFVLAAAQRLGLGIRPAKREPQLLEVAVGPADTVGLPEIVLHQLPPARDGVWRVTFVSPTPEGADYLGRNHPLVAALARYLFEQALSAPEDALASRTGLIRTDAVACRHELYLLRVRYLVSIPQRTSLLSEELLVLACRQSDEGRRQWLEDDQALLLLSSARPAANVPLDTKRRRVAELIERLPQLDSDFAAHIAARAAELEAAHKRIRQAVKLRVRELRVEPQGAPDILGLLVLEPKEGDR